MTPDSPISREFRLAEIQKKALAKLGIETVKDLLYHFPSRYGDTSDMRTIGSLAEGDSAVVFGTVSSLKTSKAFVKKIPMGEGVVTDDSGSIKLVWFNQPYIAKMVRDGQLVRVEGKVSKRKDSLYMSNPKVEPVRKVPDAVGSSLFGPGHEEHSLYPVYPESRGITSNWFYHAIQKILSSGILDTLTDPIPGEILSRYNLPAQKTAFVWIHAPKNEGHALSARKRFAFQEIFFIQLQKQQERRRWMNERAFSIHPDRKRMDNFISRFPFTPTDSQKKAVGAILADMATGRPMSRLLEGDVGSGKTAVAASATYATITTRPNGQDYGTLQVAYMAPTEILAAQHYENFITYFTPRSGEPVIKIGLITGSGCRIFPSKVNPRASTVISRAQLLKWVKNGEIPILIGTHALIQKSVAWKHLALAVIDEQHRFGTAQRQALASKGGIVPHLLSMTATPIPRTLALTLYGDLDLTLLDQMPAGRKPIITRIILPTDREKMYEEIRAELVNGRQLYVICPRINEPDTDKEMAVIAKSVNEEAARLKRDVFPEYAIGILHSKMTPVEKEKMMQAFSAGRTHILVATSVVEVGVNVPNATMILIEGAERFGLSQLHQLRGRVIRSNHQAYCFVFAESGGAKTRDRLKALTTARNGFELAEFDLAQRGAGELYGRKQWGISDIGMEAIKNIKMVEAARAEAARIVDDDPELIHYPVLAECVGAMAKKIHFE